MGVGRSLPSLSRLSSREMCFERAYVSCSARTGDLNTLVDSSKLHCFLRRGSGEGMMNSKMTIITEQIKNFIIPLLRHFTIFGQENAQNMRR